jgi:hypothetical protein
MHSALDPAALRKLATVYADRKSTAHRPIHAAVTAVLRGACQSPVVELGVENLLAHYDGKADLCDVERAERYLVECWAECAPPAPAAALPSVACGSLN